jgi:predicted nucleic acid-binding Zn ribbon protein
MAGFKEEPKPKCPNCAGEMNKVFSSPPVTFKGSGWASKEK